MKTAFQKATRGFKNLTHQFNQIKTTAVLFAVGNIPIYWDVFDVQQVIPGSAMGLGFSLAAAFAVVGSRIYEMVEGVPREKSSVPHLTLGACNVGACLSSLYALTQSDPTMLSIGMTAAFGFWGSANIFKGIELRTGEKRKGIQNPMIHWPLGDISATQFTTPASFLGAVALARAFHEKPEDREINVQSITDFAKKHITSARVLSGSYALAATSLITDHLLVSLGFLAFTEGYRVMGHDLNQTFIKDMKAVMN